MTAATMKRRTLSYGVVGLLLAAAPFLSGGAARADAPLSFNASASADPVRVLTTIANFPATKSPVDSGGPSAQATLSTTNGGTAYSAAPDPGSFFTSLPTIGAGVAAQNGLVFPFNVPPYPLAIRADDQQPSQSVGAGGYELNADVAPSSAVARTQTGAQSPGGNVALSLANAEITSTAQGVKAEAVSDIQSLTVGPLTLAGIRSVAGVISDQTGSLTRSSSFSVDAARIGTLPVGLAPDGFTVAGQPVPAADQKTMNDTLAASGISLTQFPAHQTDTGLVGAGLVVTQKFDSPQFGATQIAYRIGGVAVSLQASAPLGASTSAATPAAPATVPGAALGLGALNPGPMASGGLATDVVSDPAAPAGAPTPEIRTVQMVPASAPLPVSPDGNLLYLAIVIAGLLGLGVTRLLRASG
ncbi:MAG TPA: hypothetical protein VE081_09570 [Sporichthyaceae bacterium]|nr:hypothetical protein [Sporichthyaceae bacterium]